MGRGTDHPNQSEFLEIVPNSMVRIKHINQPLFELSISLESSATGTLVSWAGAFENHELAFLEVTTEQYLNRLALEVSTGTQQ